MNTNLWKVNYNNYEEQIINYIKTNKKGLMLLDTSKTKFDLLEKVVYDISMYHFKRLNISFNSNEYYIEFWFKDSITKINTYNQESINSFHCDCDENERKINDNVW